MDKLAHSKTPLQKGTCSLQAIWKRCGCWPRPFESARHRHAPCCVSWVSTCLTLCSTLHVSLNPAASQLPSLGFHPAILQQPLGALLCFYFWERMCFCFALIAQLPTGDSTALLKMLVIFKELFLSCHPKSYIVQQQAASINH